MCAVNNNVSREFAQIFKSTNISQNFLNLSGFFRKLPNFSINLSEIFLLNPSLLYISAVPYCLENFLFPSSYNLSISNSYFQPLRRPL